MNNAEKIQVVMNTIAQLTMPASYENANKLIGIYSMLVEIRDDLQEKAVEQDG